MNSLLYTSILGASLFLSSADAFPNDKLRINRLVTGKNRKLSNDLKELHPNIESRMISVNIDAIDNINILSSGLDHNCVTFERDSKIRCWGSNGSGQLGLGDTITRGDDPNEMGEKLPYVNLGKKNIAAQLFLGGYHTCVVMNKDERAKCWGDNRYGQLALGDTNNRGDQPNEMGDKLPFIDFGSEKRVRGIATGYMHTCAYLANAKVACFGNNDHGQLGLGHTKSIGGLLNEVGVYTAFIDIPVADGASITSSGSANHTCTRYIQAVRCWGANGSGQLGYGDTNNRGDQPNEMGTNLQPLSFISGRSISWVYIGGSNTCLFSSFTIYCLGNNQYGQLGLGHTNNIGDQANETGNNLKPVLLGAEVKAAWVSIGLNHICIVLINRSLKCLGNNAYGQLGQGDKVDRGTTAASIGDNLPVVNFNTSGHVVYPGAGRDRTCVPFEIDGKRNILKCFGYGANGALGYGDTNNRGDEPNEMGDNLPSVYLRYAPPSKSPSQAPTFKPTKQPTRKPSKNPTEYPTRKPSKTPTQKPTKKPK